MMIFRTESEAWTGIADTLEMIRSMPPFEISAFVLSLGYKAESAGLCSVICSLREDNSISASLRDQMLSTIYREVDSSQNRNVINTGFLFPRYKWKPRTELCRRFAIESER